MLLLQTTLEVSNGAHSQHLSGQTATTVACTGMCELLFYLYSNRKGK